MKMILVRGLPGSGKSTIARQLQDVMNMHLEADMYFMNDGNYEFDMAKLGRAHDWCQETARSWLHNGKTFDQDRGVIVSNTFTTIKELRPYFNIAKEFNIVPNVILAQGNFGNVHNVPEETLKRMRDRFVYDISELYNE